MVVESVTGHGINGGIRNTERNIMAKGKNPRKEKKKPKTRPKNKKEKSTKKP